MVVGYIRVSKNEQNTDLQKDALKKYGCEKIFHEKLSGARKIRPEYEKMNAQLREGDVVVVWRVDRLGRTTLELIKLMVELRERGIHFISDTEGINTDTPMGKIWFMLCAVMAENEREVNIERTRAGLASARARGRLGGRPAGLSDKAKNKAAIAVSLYKEGKMTTMEIIDSLGIKSKATLYSYLRKSGVVIKSWVDDGAKTEAATTETAGIDKAGTEEPPKKNKSGALPVKAKPSLKTELEKLISTPIPTDKRNKVKFEVVSLADAKKMVKVGAKCWTEILQENGIDRKITYFNSPDKAIKEKGKTHSAGRIWIEHVDTKDVAYVVDKDRKRIL
jgi:DNA invertase Pin-like site-specific DNA recombinase